MHHPENLSWSSAGGYVSDGGLETDLIFNRGVDLPEFASFPLVEDERGRALLRDYYDGYAEIARKAGAGLTLESPTWRANPDWGARVGYDAVALDRVNRAAIAFLAPAARVLRRPRRRPDHRCRRSTRRRVRRRPGDRSGPRPPTTTASRWRHSPPRASTWSRRTRSPPPRRASGSRAPRGRPGCRCWSGSPSRPTAGCRTAPRCARRWRSSTPRRHPTASSSTAPTRPTSRPAWTGGEWLRRIVQVNPNASTLSHAELDEAEELDAGDLDLLTSSYDALRAQLPGLAVVGGCCGTDARHVSALWGF